jgi:hypothetical protein
MFNTQREIKYGTLMCLSFANVHMCMSLYWTLHAKCYVDFEISHSLTLIANWFICWCSWTCHFLLFYVSSWVMPTVLLLLLEQLGFFNMKFVVFCVDIYIRSNNERLNAQDDWINKYIHNVLVVAQHFALQAAWEKNLLIAV